VQQVKAEECSRNVAHLLAAVLVCPLEPQRDVVGVRIAGQVLGQAEVDDVLESGEKIFTCCETSAALGSAEAN
jgi:hypothetical protein